MDAIAAVSGAAGRPTIWHHPSQTRTVYMFRLFITWASTENLIPDSRLRVIPTHDGILASFREVAAGREKFAATIPSAKVLYVVWKSIHDNGKSPAGSAEDLRAAEVLYLTVLRQGAAVMHLQGMAAVRQRRAIRRIRRAGFPLVTSQPVTGVVTINEHDAFEYRSSPLLISGEGNDILNESLACDFAGATGMRGLDTGRTSDRCTRSHSGCRIDRSEGQCQADAFLAYYVPYLYRRCVPFNIICDSWGSFIAFDCGHLQ